MILPDETATRAAGAALARLLVPGDVSWARDLETVRPDLEWLAQRPGTKLLIKGNHEHWWPTSRRKLEAALPPGIRALSGDAVRVGDVAVCGTRLWDAPGVSNHDVLAWEGEPIAAVMREADSAAALKVYEREVGRLERALVAVVRAAPRRNRSRAAIRTRCRDSRMCHSKVDSFPCNSSCSTTSHITASPGTRC